MPTPRSRRLWRRPGDVEKVKAIGLNKYIEQQLNPNLLHDSAVEAKLRNFVVLKLSNEQLFAKYPNQGALLNLVAQQNGMNRRELQAQRSEAREERQQ